MKTLTFTFLFYRCISLAQPSPKMALTKESLTCRYIWPFSLSLFFLLIRCGLYMCMCIGVYLTIYGIKVWQLVFDRTSIYLHLKIYKKNFVYTMIVLNIHMHKFEYPLKVVRYWGAIAMRKVGVFLVFLESWFVHDTWFA